MTVQLIPTGRPCEICKAPSRDATEYADARLHGNLHLEPREVVVPPTPADSIPAGASFSYTTGDGSLSSAPDKQIFRVERDGADIGTYCAKCLRAACETAAGTGKVGADVIMSMRDRAQRA